MKRAFDVTHRVNESDTSDTSPATSVARVSKEGILTYTHEEGSEMPRRERIPVNLEPGSTHKHTLAELRGGGGSNKTIATCAIAIYNAYGEIQRHGARSEDARRITCAIAIQNAQSVSRTETETSLKN